ncbi:MAG: hypothetical protein CL605_01720 [Altibacter sp.]|nr:hypothetical protein [Altibacter sp.]|tara:strand:- start:15056 stop:16282 length:1227 start_codon:yes stop_codon:yes gene_type:complete
MSGYFKTIGDLERATYGFGSDNLMKATGITTGIHNVHSLATQAGTLDTSLHNLIYGQKVWSMINREINALSILPKKPWKSSGWRILKERALGGAEDTFTVTDSDSLGGTAENEALSNITNIRPLYENLHVSPKTIAHTFEISEIAQMLAGLDDGLGDLIATYREEVGVSHAEAMNKMILHDLTNTAGVGLAATSLTGENNMLESLFRIVSNFAETDALSGYGSGEDKNKIYGVSRHATDAAYLESFVDSNGGTERNLTVNILNTTLRNLMARGGEPKVILTGYDTIQTLGELLQAQERFMGRTEITPTHNGIRGVDGREVGFRVATYHDIPIIPVKDMPNGGAGISDILILDTDHIFLCTLKPTEYFEGGIGTDVFGHGKLGHRGLYRTVAEVVCSYFRGQGKILDLQ